MKKRTFLIENKSLGKKLIFGKFDLRKGNTEEGEALWMADEYSLINGEKVMSRRCNLNQGYWHCNLPDLDGDKYKMRVSKMMWHLHSGEEVPKGYVVDHINGISTDDRIQNLQIMKRGDNWTKGKKDTGVASLDLRNKIWELLKDNENTITSICNTLNTTMGVVTSVKRFKDECYKWFNIIELENRTFSDIFAERKQFIKEEKLNKKQNA